MDYLIGKLVAQSSSAALTPLKDVAFYYKNKAKYVKELEGNLREFTGQMITVYSRKNQIDQIPETSVFKEESKEYRILCKQIEALREDYDKFIRKYGKYCGDLLNEIPVLDASNASNIMDLLHEKMPTIKTRRFFVLVRLKKNVKKLHGYVSEVANKVKPNNSILEMEPELVQVKHVHIDLPSVNEYVSEILRYLGKDKNRSIGVVGSPGVGKTNIMKRLNNQFGGNTSLKLDVVIWIDYPEELGTKEKIIKKMQDSIMERLKLKLEKASNIEQNAEIISMALSWKKYIVLIDHVSSTIDLDEVGIHRYHKFGKVVVASSNKKVIKQMTDQQVEVKTLPLVDARILFLNVCGAVDDSRIRIIADEMIESCGGLPLVIMLVAKHLKGERDKNVWSDAKRMLQSKPKTDKLQKLGVIANAYKLVYDALEESYLKKCLLFGALFPRNHKIDKDYLVECWMAEGFLDRDTDVRQLRSGREHGATVLKELTDKYLLEQCSDNKYVKTPEFFRIVALEEQYPEEKNCVIWAPRGNELPREAIWRTITRMSLISCNLNLPECPESHNISTLLLQCNPELVQIGDSFFSNMEKLRILDMNQTDIISLPTSISRLGNLISLYLNDCIGLAELPPEVNKLTKIEILDIRGTSIPNLPQEIGDMIRLRCLRVSFAPKGCNRNSKGKEVEVKISPNIISRLEQLEELIVETGCCNPSWNNNANQIAHELASLENLSTLSFHFPTVYSLERFVADSKSWRNTKTFWETNTFKSFNISIGCCETQHSYGSDITGILADRQLRFSTNEEISSVKEVLKQASAFELVGHHEVPSLSEFNLENAGALKVCVIEGCNNLLSIVDVHKTDDFGLLQCLEKLHLFNLPSLQCIWKGSSNSRSFLNLQVLTICNCPELTSILDHKLAEALSSLKHLKVKNCDEVVEIVNVQEDVDNSGILQRVENIEVVNLPNLESICRSASMKWNSLQTIVTISCKKLRNLPLTSSNAERLETIKCEASWWTDQLQLSEEEKQRFLPRCFFIDVEEESWRNARSVNAQTPDNNESQDITLKTDMMKQWPAMKVLMQVSPSWMGYEIEKLVAQSSSTAYSPLKDMSLYLKSKAKYVKELELNLTELTVEMITVYSRKEQVDRLLEMSVSKEKREEYRILCKQIEALRKDYDKFIKKYGKFCGGDLPSEMPAELDVSTAENIIAMLQGKRPTIKTRKFFKLAELSKNIKKLHGYVSEVAHKMKTENLIREMEPELVQAKHDDIDLPSVNEYVRKILRYLREDENRSIGVVGTTGVGKTNIMKRLNNQLEGNMSLRLDIVIWIDYPEEIGTEEKTIKMMQDVIIKRLKLKLEKANSIKQNAEIISMALNRKKYVVLIDQVSSTIDLGEVGIQKDHKFGKVVLASSNNKVINQMTDQQFEVKTLPLVDSWTLFENVCSAVDDPQIRIIADEIIRSCGGLPLVIKLVAKHLKGERDKNMWSDAKRMLQSKPKTGKQQKLGVIANAYKLVYDALEESYLKKCLLFGALFPSNHKICKDYLVECWMAEGFLDRDTDVRQLRSGREHGATVLKELTDTYLLEQCSDNKYVKMPEIFRIVALEQQYPEAENCVIWAPRGNELPREAIWRTIARMSLISCNPNLPECPESHNISTLLLQCNPELVQIGDSFFSNMENLRILDMNQTHIVSLPTSISRLGNLISLYLNDCIGLAELPPEVNKLTKIEILDIRGTSIPNLPQEIGNMIRLRCLRVSFAPKGCNRNGKGKEVEVMISPNIISRLQQLEELIVETGCCNPSWNDNANQMALELASLENLSTLSFHFPTVYSLERFVADSKSWRNTKTFWETNTFKSFNISIGCCETQHPYGSEIMGILAERQLRFSTNEEISSVKEVLKQASAFELVGHHEVQSLSAFDLENAGALKVCVIEGCSNLLSIVDVHKTVDFGLLQCLEKLHLFNLPSLQCIWNGSVFTGSLLNLKVLTICGCHKLTRILDLKLAQSLSSLKHLRVENCEGVVEIVNAQDHGEIVDVPVDVDNSGILQKVETIEVVNLPDLESICGSASMKWNSLRTIVVISCKNLRSLPLTLSNAETLETIKCEESWWTDRLQKSKKEEQRFLPRCVFIVSDNNGSKVYNSEDGHDEAMVSNDSSSADVVREAEKLEDGIRHKAKLVSTIHQTSQAIKEPEILPVLGETSYEMDLQVPTD